MSWYDTVDGRNGISRAAETRGSGAGASDGLSAHEQARLVYLTISYPRSSKREDSPDT